MRVSNLRKPGRFFTAAEDETVLAMWSAGKTHKQIGIALGRTKASIESRCDKLGLADAVGYQRPVPDAWVWPENYRRRR